MKLSYFLAGALCFAVVGCSKPKAFAAAEEWHKVGDEEKEKLCSSLKDNPAGLIGALQSWVKDATPKIQGKSTEFASAINELKDKGEFEKLKAIVDGFDSIEEPCDKMKAAFSPEQLNSYAEVNTQIKAAVDAAAKAYETKAKEFGVTVDIAKFRP